MKPILFNTPMVQAILDGRKTCTRRILKPHYKDDEYGFQVCRNKANPNDWFVEKTDKNECGFDSQRFISPKYKVGDILYVRETWSEWGCSNCAKYECIGCSGALPYVYKADYDDGEIKWHPSIHMPKEAARIFLRVTDVLVEKLQDIKYHERYMEDEGLDIEEILGIDPIHSLILDEGWNALHEGFKNLWDSTVSKKDLNKYGWSANPWVYVYEFERISKKEADTNEAK